MSDIITAVPHVITTVESQPAVWIAGPTCVRCNVAGEAYNQQQMQHIVRQVQARTDHVLPAWLSEEPGNRFDPNAIMVWVSGGKVGYLPAAVTARWKPVLKSLLDRYGHNVACQATVDPPSAANQGGYGMVLWLPPLPLPPPPALTISEAGAASVRRILASWSYKRPLRPLKRRPRRHEPLRRRCNPLSCLSRRPRLSRHQPHQPGRSRLHASLRLRRPHLSSVRHSLSSSGPT